MPKQTAYHFFFSQAGYSHSPAIETAIQGKRRCAKALAAAEAEADARHCSFSWDVDTYDSSEWSDETPAYAQYVCTGRYADGRIFACLGGIDFGRDRDPWMDDYRRVIEAELALEMDDRDMAAQYYAK